MEEQKSMQKIKSIVRNMISVYPGQYQTLQLCQNYCLPYVKIGGTFISYKSGTVQEEAEEAEKAINILGGQVKDITYFKLPDSEIDRSLVIINKKKSTPGKYPRKAGTPLKEPLS